MFEYSRDTRMCKYRFSNNSIKLPYGYVAPTHASVWACHRILRMGYTTHTHSRWRYGAGSVRAARECVWLYLLSILLLLNYVFMNLCAKWIHRSILWCAILLKLRCKAQKSFRVDAENHRMQHFPVEIEYTRTHARSLSRPHPAPRWYTPR